MAVMPIEMLFGPWDCADGRSEQCDWRIVAVAVLVAVKVTVRSIPVPREFSKKRRTKSRRL